VTIFMGSATLAESPPPPRPLGHVAQREPEDPPALDRQPHVPLAVAPHGVDELSFDDRVGLGAFEAMAAAAAVAWERTPPVARGRRHPAALLGQHAMADGVDAWWTTCNRPAATRLSIPFLLRPRLVNCARVAMPCWAPASAAIARSVAPLPSI
jgi:hypothetical protein